MTVLVVVAGGEGTRLAPEIGSLPKVLAPIGGRPNLDRLLEIAIEFDISKVIILTGAGGQQIADHVSNLAISAKVQTEIRQERSPKGTAGCFHGLGSVIGDTMMVLYGDISCDFDLNRFEQFHRDHGAAATLLVQPNSHIYDSDLVVVDDDDIVTGIKCKPHDPDSHLENLTSAAAYILEPAALDWIPNTPCDWLQDVFPRMLESGVRIMAYRSWEYLHDFGTPDRYEKAQFDAQCGILGNRRADNRNGGLFLDVDTTALFPNSVIQKIKSANRLRIPVVLLGTISIAQQLQLNHELVYADSNVEIDSNNSSSIEDLSVSIGIAFSQSEHIRISRFL